MGWLCLGAGPFGGDTVLYLREEQGKVFAR